MIDIVSGVGRLVVGASGSPGSLGALRYARNLACLIDVPVVAVQAWVPPGGDLAERRCPSAGMGAGRRGVLSRMWQGTVSRYCLSHARCPVLGVPQPATAREMGLGPGVWPLRHRGLTLDRALREWDAA